MRSRLRRVLCVAFLVAMIAPLGIIVAWAGTENCCFGTTCAEYLGCKKDFGQPYNQTCKRMCDPPCQQTERCCQFQYRTVTYSQDPQHEETCVPPNPNSCQEVVNAGVDPDGYCRSGANEVACLATAANTCEP